MGDSVEFINLLFGGGGGVGSVYVCARLFVPVLVRVCVCLCAFVFVRLCVCACK